MSKYFKPTEATIDGSMPPADVCAKLERYHFVMLDGIRELLGAPIRISKGSGYRPPEHEIAKGRSGTSEHCFRGNGALDLTADDVRKLYDLLVMHSTYTRICFYPKNGFIHCDHKLIPGNRRALYQCQSPTSDWELVRYVQK